MKIVINYRPILSHLDGTPTFSDVDASTLLCLLFEKLLKAYIISNDEYALTLDSIAEEFDETRYHIIQEIDALIRRTEMPSIVLEVDVTEISPTGVLLAELHDA